MNTTLYIKANQKSIIYNKKIYIKDIAAIYSSDKNLEKQINNTLLTQIKLNENQKIIFSILYVIDIILKNHPHTQIINIGETDFIIDYQKPKPPNLIWEYTKAALVCLIVFFGSGFTIMTFNADVNVAHLFDKLNTLLLGTKKGHHVIEISYSIGIGLGILLFFNQFSRRKLEEELTPLQIEMRSYEEEINTAFIADANREGKLKEPH